MIRKNQLTQSELLLMIYQAIMELNQDLKLVMKLHTDFSEDYYDSSDIKIKFKISERKLCRMRKADEIPFTHFGRKIIYPKNEVLKKLNAGM